MKKFRCRFYDPSYHMFKARVITITATNAYEAEKELRRWNTVTELISIHEIKPKIK